MNTKVIESRTTAEEWTEREWDIFRDWIHGMLKSNTVTVTFVKKDGNERVMKCTLDPELLPPQVVKEDKKERKVPEHSIAVFDTEIKEWRSFVIRSVRKIELTL